MTDNEARSELRQLDDRIASLENELQQLKQQRVTQQGRSPKPLDGVRVLDLSRYIFGPFCTQTLGDLGADIIKVEPRQGGDPARYIGGPAEDGVSVSFLARNRNKRSLAMDMRKPAAQDILRRLAERSDVLMHNFRPGIMDRMGLAPEQLRALNPTLIYCSLSGYGQSGPMAAWPGQDLLIQGMSGIISTTDAAGIAVFMSGAPRPGFSFEKLVIATSRMTWLRLGVIISSDDKTGFYWFFWGKRG